MLAVLFANNIRKRSPKGASDVPSPRGPVSRVLVKFSIM